LRGGDKNLDEEDEEEEAEDVGAAEPTAIPLNAFVVLERVLRNGGGGG